MNFSKLNKIFLLVIVLFFVTGYIAYPLLILIKESLASGTVSYTALFSSAALEASRNSILLSLITVIGGAIIGIYFAYIFHYKNIPLKSFFSAFLLIPVATPPIVGVVAFVYLVSDNGMLPRLIESLFGVKDLFTFDGWKAIIIVHLYSFYPFFFLFASSGLKKIDSTMPEASYALGASKTKTFFKVILPVLTPSLVSASLIVFMASMASFSAPFIFGGSGRFLTTEIYYAKINGDTSYASALAILLTIISIAFLFLLRQYRKKESFAFTSKGTSKVITFAPGAKLDKTGTVTSFVFTLLVSLPILALLYLSFVPEGSLMRNIFAEPLTLGNYIRLFRESNVSEPFVNSLRMSVVAVAITLLIGISSAFLIVKKRVKFKRLLEMLISVPYGIPGTVIALAFIISFNLPTVFTFFTAIVGTFWILPLAYAVRNLPVLTQSAIAGFQTLDPSLEEASASLGSKGFRTFRKIIIPVIYPSILYGALLVFIASVGEFVSTILLYTYSTRTVSVEIYSQMRMYNTGIGTAYGVILFVIVMLVVYLSRRTLGRTVGI